MSGLILPSYLDGDFVAQGVGPTGWSIPTAPTRVSAAGDAVARCGPLGLVSLAAWAEAAHRQGGVLTVDDSLKSPYALQTGLLHALVNAIPAVDKVEPRNDWYPLCRVSSQFLPQLHRVVPEGAGLSSEVRGALGYCVRELARNVDEHAGTACGTFFAASWFPRRRRVVFALADAGNGLRWKLEQRGIVQPGDPDRLVLERAVQAHITGAAPDQKGSPYGSVNAGLGLYMTRRITAETGGDFLLQSLGARLTAEGGEVHLEDTSFWKGTLVAVSLVPERLSDFTALFHQVVAETEGAGSDDSLHFAAGPREALEVRLTVDVSGFAADKDEAIRHQASVRQELAEGSTVTIEFGTGQFTTQSAMHALLHVAIRETGPDGVRRIYFSNARPQIRAVVRQVVAYSLLVHVAKEAPVST